MLTLILLRHGKAAAESSGSDRDRALTGRGRRDARDAGARLGALGLNPGLVLVSTAVRTRQTAEHALADLAGVGETRFEDQLYGASESSLLATLRAEGGAASPVLVIGHNPGLGELARSLVREADPIELADLRQRFPTSTMAILDFDLASWATLDRRSGTLRAFILPDNPE